MSKTVMGLQAVMGLAALLVAMSAHAALCQDKPPQATRSLSGITSTVPDAAADRHGDDQGRAEHVGDNVSGGNDTGVAKTTAGSTGQAGASNNGSPDKAPADAKTTAGSSGQASSSDSGSHDKAPNAAKTQHATQSQAHNSRRDRDRSIEGRYGWIERRLGAAGSDFNGSDVRNYLSGQGLPSR
jgi:hypothetical protein